MPVKKIKPITPGQRHRVAPTFEEITTSRPEKSLVTIKKRTGGRDNFGHRASRYIGGGHKRKYRIIDFKRDKDGVPAVVKSIEYDPNRTSRIALLYYKDGEKRYIGTKRIGSRPNNNVRKWCRTRNRKFTISIRNSIGNNNSQCRIISR